MEVWKRNLAVRAKRLGIKRKVTRRRLMLQEKDDAMLRRINSGLADLYLGLCAHAAFEGNVQGVMDYANAFNAQKFANLMPRTREKLAKYRAQIDESGISAEAEELFDRLGVGKEPDEDDDSNVKSRPETPRRRVA